jgi:26S proteasome regulatory subunit N3
VSQAVRKAPQTSALGFRQTATKLLVIVQLLMGEIPERAIFMVDHMRGALQPYLELTKAVRVGDLAKFEEAVTTHKAVWERDGMTSLISRLRNNVIKTGLRKLNTSYSRIPLADVCSKLNLDSVEDAEFIVSKCIHDGVVDAGIDAEGNFMFSKERDDKYATLAPFSFTEHQTTLSYFFLSIMIYSLSQQQCNSNTHHAALTTRTPSGMLLTRPKPCSTSA